MKCSNQEARFFQGRSTGTHRRRHDFESGSILRLSALLLVLLFVAGGVLAKPATRGPEPILLVVMDPLAKELACACVKGHGQRDYRKLAARMETTLKQRVSIEFSDDLAESMVGVSPAREVIVVGDQSLVAHGAKKAGLPCHPVCELTDPDGNTTLTALFIARFDDPARELKDLGGRKVLFGLADGDEKVAASLAALRAAGVEPVGTPEKHASFSDAALDLLDSQSSPPPVAVIPSYALALLEGCGSVKPGNLKVIGKTQPVPFITVFVADTIPAERQQKLLKTLLNINADAKLLKAMESRDGFRPVQGREPGGTKASTGPNWPDWRGPARDGHVPRLPARLPVTARFVWKKAAMIGGLAGLSVSGERLILAERDFDEEHDVYRCLNAHNGELLWRVEFPARGKLDYGQAPRATPVIHADKAYLLGAFGDLRCVNLTNGRLIWQRSLPREFKATLPTWGMCATPLLVDDLLIVNPGGTNASLVALDCATGHTRWTTPGLPAAYSAFICGEFGSRRQVVGYDRNSLGGWDVKTGRRLWQLVPPAEGDFNVPTPVAVDGGVIVSTENNGTRFYRFDESGRIIATPAAQYADLSPDTVSPVVTCGRVFGANSGLRCLDLHNGLKPVWHRQEAALDDHLTLIADDDRVLVITLRGELILLDGRTDTCTIISRLRLFDDDVEVYSHPALVGTRLYVRGGSSLVCVDLGTD
ncbi:PQQ-binding-like beta-propeller repeat protein [Pedosphaera parvula]|uniref:FOG: WD40-like repeat-like protein n=1 Tax=Pedosphaera parvula (strain Ellin514) TaxID=320771 RepID=B9XHD6_PEDPL|nr:PQQ-binding-like beta-propeller repeat protein [Pedosphaera parvula]EEF60771.1 FOG: WD40-like repeat-like protein [Pedosphaera parvula Ellin514]